MRFSRRRLRRRRGPCERLDAKGVQLGRQSVNLAFRPAQCCGYLLIFGGQPSCFSSQLGRLAPLANGVGETEYGYAGKQHDQYDSIGLDGADGVDTCSSVQILPDRKTKLPTIARRPSRSGPTAAPSLEPWIVRLAGSAMRVLKVMGPMAKGSAIAVKPPTHAEQR
jgi:hypothetical protein